MIRWGTRLCRPGTVKGVGLLSLQERRAPEIDLHDALDEISMAEVCECFYGASCPAFELEVAVDRALGIVPGTYVAFEDIAAPVVRVSVLARGT